jgi:hypothetical protein
MMLSLLLLLLLLLQLPLLLLLLLSRSIIERWRYSRIHSSSSNS